MPPQPPVLLTLKFGLNGTWAGQPWANIFHAKYSGGPPTAADLTTLATGMATAYHTRFMPNMNGNVTLDHTKVTDLSTLSSPSVDQATGFSGGGGLGPTVTNNTALGLAWHGHLRYRGGHAKTFLPGMLRNNLQDSLTWDPSFLGATQAAAIGFLSDVAALTAGTTVVGGLVMVHYRLGKTVLTPPQVEDLTAVTAKSAIYSQRGRRSA